MSFQTATYLRKATSRAKSDVANKMVSMFLHDLSRKVNSSLGANVTDIRYADAVTAAFGNSCCYCSRSLEHDRAAVEHLDGMNRFRVGLHIQGNVIVACKRCNGEKRRDDQPRELSLAESGWECSCRTIPRVALRSARHAPTGKSCYVTMVIALRASGRHGIEFRISAIPTLKQSDGAAEPNRPCNRRWTRFIENVRSSPQFEFAKP